MAAKKTKKEKILPLNFLKFLGTAGARFVMIRQLRSSGGVWVNCAGTNVLIDPGPGSIVRCANSRPKLDPATLDGIILTHRHLDHSGDVNVMIEAMTEGGFKKRGVVFCPEDAIKEDSIFLKYLLNFPEKIEILKPKREYQAGNFKFTTSMPHLHPVTTFGLKFKINQTLISLVTDTKYFEELADFYTCDVLILAVVFLKERNDVEHLSLADAQRLIAEIKPKIAILTHFGMTMLKARPQLLAEELSKKLKVEVKAAYDGMMLTF